MRNIAQTTEPRAALAFGHGEEAHQDVRQPGGAEHEREAERDRVDRRTPGTCPGASENVDSAVLFASASVEQLDRVPADPVEHEHRHHDDAGHQQHGLDDLHPRRGEHAAEDHVAEHERRR